MMLWQPSCFTKVILKTIQSLKTILESNLDLERPQAKSPHGGHLVFKMVAAPNFFLKKARAFAPKMNVKNPKKIFLAILPQLMKEESEKKEKKTRT